LPKRDGTLTHVPFSRDPKARREALADKLPLQEGRKVAFHPPASKTSDGASADVDENTWILAVVVECINQDKNRYALYTDRILPGPHVLSPVVMWCRMSSLKKTDNLDSRMILFDIHPMLAH
jgi:hypothetical protein